MDDWDRIEKMFRVANGKQLRSLERRISGVVARAVLGSATSDGGTTTATATLREGDEDADVEVFEAYGFTSAPLAGAEGVGLTVGGDNTHRLLVCVGDRRHRPTDLAAGEVAVYRNAAGHRVIMKADGSTEITTPAAGQAIVLKANGDVVITPGAGAKLLLGDEAAATKVSLVNELNTLRAAFNSHTHPTAPVGPVSTPTPVPFIVPVPLFTGAGNVYGKG